MRGCAGNVIEGLVGEVPPHMLLLVAMLENQLDDLARMYAQGMWEDDPQEIGRTLRGLRMNDYVNRIAMEEWLLWTGATDALIAALERYTPVRIDRARIASLAKKRASRLKGDGRMRHVIG